MLVTLTLNVQVGFLFSEWADGNSRSAAVLNAISQTLKKTLPEESPKHERWPERLFLKPRDSPHVQKLQANDVVKSRSEKFQGKKKKKKSWHLTLSRVSFSRYETYSNYINHYECIIHIKVPGLKRFPKAFLKITVFFLLWRTF